MYENTIISSCLLSLVYLNVKCINETTALSHNKSITNRILFLNSLCFTFTSLVVANNHYRNEYTYYEHLTNDHSRTFIEWVIHNYFLNNYFMNLK